MKRAGSPHVPKCQICCVKLGLFFPHSHFPHFHTFPVLSPLSSSTSPSSILPRPSPFPKRWTRNLAIAGRTRSTSLKHTNAIPTANTAFTLSLYCLLVCTGRTHNVVDLSIRPSVRSFVCYQLVNENEWTNFNANWHKSSPGQEHERSTSGVRRSKVKVIGGRSSVWKPGCWIPWIE